MLDVSRRSAAVVVLFGSLVARGDGCSGDAPPGDPGVAQCSGDAAIIGLVPGYCAAIPNCLDGLPYYDMTFTLEPKASLPDWLEFRTARGELADADASLPVDAFRVCATRMAMPDEAATVTLDVLARQPSRSREVTQKATVLVRPTLPSVRIGGVPNRAEWFRESTNTATGDVSALAREGASFRLEVFTSHSKASSCADLNWTIAATDGLATTARVVCDETRVSEATIRLDVAPNRSYSVVLEVTEPEGLKSRSNAFLVRTAADDPSRLTLEIAGAPGDVIPPYERVMLEPQCTRGLWVTTACQVSNVTWYLNPGAPVISETYALQLTSGASLGLKVSGYVEGIDVVNSSERTFTAR